MTTVLTPFEESADLIDKCRLVIDELEAGCCVPRRSPQMESLRSTLESIWEHLRSYDESTGNAERTVSVVEEAGSQIGRLQVTCCAPGRMPLYDELLHNLMKVQRIVKRHAKLAH